MVPKLVGVYPFSDRRPTFGLPIFRLGNQWMIQRPQFGDDDQFSFESIDPSEVENKIVFSKTDVDPSGRIFAVVGVGDQLEVGTKSDISGRLLSLSKGQQGSGIALQAAEILGSDEDRRLALANVTRSIKLKNSVRSANSFAKSAALSIAWDQIEKSQMDEADKRSVLAQLHMINIKVDGLNPQIDISELEKSVQALIDVDSLVLAIKKEVSEPILSTADNDRSSEYDISSEVSKVRDYLNRNIGPDKRMTASSYYRLIRIAGIMGIHGLDEIAEIIQDYDGSEVSAIATGAQQGQTGRVELMLMAALGEEYTKRYPYDGNVYLKKHHLNMLEQLRKAGVKVGVRQPRHPANRKFGTLRRTQRRDFPPSLFDLLEPPNTSGTT